MKLPSTSFLNFADLYEYQGVKFFDTPDFPPVPSSSTDTYQLIDTEYIGRLDLLAFDNYGDAELWWVIALANDISSIEQMQLGITLRIPNITTVRTYLANRKGV